MRKLAALVLLVMTLASTGEVVLGQTFPRVRLETITPAGGKVGTTVEVILGGADLDDVKTLLVSDKRLKVDFVPPPGPDPKTKKPAPEGPPKFKITIPANLPVGQYDIRAIGKWGISNPRTFEVNTLNEIVEKEPNNDIPPSAQKVELNTIINGVISSPTDVDYFSFSGKKGQRVVISCPGSSIDSMLNPEIRLFDSRNIELENNRNYQDRNAFLAAVLPSDGEYSVRLCQFAYLMGGNQHYYRLSISTLPWIEAIYPPIVEPGKANTVTLYGHNLPNAKPVTSAGKESILESVTVQITPPAGQTNQSQTSFSGYRESSQGTISGMEYRVKNGQGWSNPILLPYSQIPIVQDNGKNKTPETAQPIKLPCFVAGRVDQPGDEDWYAFTAKKGEVYTVEGFADRLGSPVDLYVKIRRKQDKQFVADFDANPEFPGIVNNQFSFNTGDPKGRFVVPSDGEYELLASTQTSYFRSGPRFLYAVEIAKEEPDFQVVMIPNNTNNIGGLTIHQAGAQSIDIVLIRQGNFEGEVILEAEGLPKGLVCSPQIIGPKLNSSVLVFQADGNAPLWAGEMKVKATANINGKAKVRHALTGCVVWPTPNNIPALSRVSRSFCAAIREKGPFTMSTNLKDVEVPHGGKLDVNVKVNRQMPDFKAQVQVVRLAAPAQPNGTFINVPNINITDKQTEGKVSFQVPTNTPSGVYSLVFEGRGKFDFHPDPKDKKKKRNVDFYDSTPPIKVTVYDQVAKVTLGQPKVEIKAGTNAELLVKVDRLHGYKGEYDVQLVIPGGFQGISGANAKIPANANEVKIKLQSPKNAKPASNPNFLVRVTGKLNNVAFTQEAKFTLTITQATSAPPPPQIVADNKRR